MMTTKNLLILDALALGFGVKPISVMIDDYVSVMRKPQPKPHQGSKEVARRLKRMKGE